MSHQSFWFCCSFSVFPIIWFVLWDTLNVIIENRSIQAQTSDFSTNTLSVLSASIFCVSSSGCCLCRALHRYPLAWTTFIGHFPGLSLLFDFLVLLEAHWIIEAAFDWIKRLATTSSQYWIQFAIIELVVAAVLLNSKSLMRVWCAWLTLFLFDIIVDNLIYEIVIYEVAPF